MLRVEIQTPKIGDCGHERDFAINGVLQVNCYDCHDHAADWSKDQLETQLREIGLAADRAQGGASVNLVSQALLLVPAYLKSPLPKGPHLKCERLHAPDVEPGDCATKDCHLDEGIAEIVYGLWERGVKTETSCDGNHQGAINERRVSFGWDDETAGPPGIAAAIAADMPVYQLRMTFPCSTAEDLALRRFYWELVFDRHQDWSRATGRAERR